MIGGGNGVQCCCWINQRFFALLFLIIVHLIGIGWCDSRTSHPSYRRRFGSTPCHMHYRIVKLPKWFAFEKIRFPCWTMKMVSFVAAKMKREIKREREKRISNVSENLWIPFLWIIIIRFDRMHAWPNQKYIELVCRFCSILKG